MLKTLSAALLLTTATSAIAEGDIKIATDIGVLSSIATLVGGDLVHVDRVIPVNSDHHNLTLKPSQVRALNNADIVLWVGEGLSAAVGHTLENSSEDKVIMTLSEDHDLRHLNSRDIEQFGSEGDDHDHSHGHDHGHDDDHEGESIDPHVWLNFENLKITAKHLSSKLSELSPNNATQFAANTDQLIADLTAIQARAGALFDGIDDAHFVTSHDAYQYFEDQFNFELEAVITGSDGAEIGPKTLSNLLEHMHDHVPSCMIVDPREGTALAEQIANDLDLTVVSVDPTGDNLEATRNNVLGLMNETVDAFARCFKLDT